MKDIISRFSHPGTSHIVYGELLLGGMKSNEPMEMSHVFGAFEGTTILNGDAETAAIYARVRWRLESQGLRIPENDIWIAAASIQARLPLITRDLHFQRIPELTVLAY